MTSIEIFTKMNCPFCHRAKALFNSKNVIFHEIAIDNDPQLRTLMISRSGRTTVPQVFIDGHHIGGCDDLYALDDRDELDRLLNLPAG